MKKILLTLFVMLFSVNAFSFYYQWDNNAKMFWDFEDNAPYLDTISGNTLFVTGTPLRITIAAMGVKGITNLGNAANYISITSTTMNTIATYATWTIEFYIYPKVAMSGGSQNDIWFQKGFFGQANSLAIQKGISFPVVGVNCNNMNNALNYPSPPSLSTGYWENCTQRWRHIAVTYGSDGKLREYVDNVLKNTSLVTIDPFKQTNDTWYWLRSKIGAADQTPSGVLDGILISNTERTVFPTLPIGVTENIYFDKHEMKYTGNEMIYLK